jgi:hypothetical protein
VTAPDPGLTDLIAAHRCAYYGPDHSDRSSTCECEWHGEDWAAHVALVVEQHTNGRIAELEADSRRTAFEDQDRIDELTVRMRRAEDAQDALKAEASGLRYDNEQFQATIARVRAVEAEYLGPEDIDIECREDVWRFIRDLRAALEGEQR